MIKNRTNTNDVDVFPCLVVIGLILLFVVCTLSFTYFFGNDFMYYDRLSTTDQFDTKNTNTDNQQETQTIVCREIFKQPVIDFCTNHSSSVLCKSEKVNRLLKSKQCPDIYHIVFYHMHMIFVRFYDNLIRFLTEHRVMARWEQILYALVIVFVSLACSCAVIKDDYINKIEKRIDDLEKKLSKKNTSLKEQTTISNNSELVIDGGDSKEKSQ